MAASTLSVAVVRGQSVGPVLAPADVLGPGATFSWTAVGGASTYVLRAGIAPGQYLTSIDVGNTTTFSAQAPAVGIYYVRVDAIVGGTPLPSNEIAVQIVSLVAPPAAPTNFAAYANGHAALLTWELSYGGGTPTGLVLYAGTQPGLSDAGIFPLGLSSALSVPFVNPGTYYLRIAGANAAGPGPASSEVMFDMPAAGACSAPPALTFTPAAFGSYAQFRWSGVPGLLGYRLEFGQQGAPISLAVPLGPGATSWSVVRAPFGSFYGHVVTGFSCGSETAGPDVPFVIDNSPPPGPRTPNPAAGQRLPLPNMFDVVRQLASERPDLMAQSCREHGGNNRFMFELVRRLRAIDNRWGLNWKRGNRGDMSQDVIDYNFGSQSDEDTTDVYIIDVIGGHCGPNPGPNWEDVTQKTIDGGTIGRWTLLPYLDAGYPIVSDPRQ